MFAELPIFGCSYKLTFRGREDLKLMFGPCLKLFDELKTNYIVGGLGIMCCLQLRISQNC